MKEIMCVVVVKSGILETVHTFIKEDGDTSGVKAAERLFEQIINGMDNHVSAEDIENCKDEGHYQSRNGCNDVWLCSSTPEEINMPTPDSMASMSIRETSVLPEVNTKYCDHCRTAITDLDDISVFCNECGSHLFFAVIIDKMHIGIMRHVRVGETIKAVKGEDHNG